MKITKRSVKACEAPAVESLVAETESVVTTCTYQAAVDKIWEAINILGPAAKEDALARESIANLSVVLFDLKG